MKKITRHPIAFLRRPLLSEAERAREERKREIIAALARCRRRLDTVRDLVRQEMSDDAGMIAQQLLIDLANLLPLLGKCEPVETPADAARALRKWAPSQSSDLVGKYEEDVILSLDLVDSHFWALRKHARTSIATELATPLDGYETRLRWLAGTCVVLALLAMPVSLKIRQRVEASQYYARLNNMPAMVDIEHADSHLREWVCTDTIDAPHGFGRNIDVDFLEAAGGEPAILPTPGTTSRLIHGGATTWRYIASPTNFVSVTELLGHREDAVVYAFVTIRAPRSMSADLLLGSDDGIKVWLNGEVVAMVNRLRVLELDEDRVQVELRKGINALLLKITQDKGPWSFSCRIVAS